MTIRVIKGGWWWLGVERKSGDVFAAADTTVAHWIRDGLVEMVSAPVIETADAPPVERATATRKKRN